MTKFTAAQFSKFGFERDAENDFSDDGNRFKAYKYGSVRVTYLSAHGEVYISAHVSEQIRERNLNVTHEEYYKTLRERHVDPDLYNGVANGKDAIDLNVLIEEIGKALMILDELDAKASEDDELSVEVVARISEERNMLTAAMSKIENVDWLHWTKPEGCYYELQDLRNWHEAFERKLGELDAIERGDGGHSHKVNARFRQYGYVVEKDDGYYVKNVERVLA